MHRNTSQVLDSVSTKDLMKALTTLQQLSKQPKKTGISFCGFDQKENPNSINFEAYMTGQITRSSNNKTGSRKSISPLKQKQSDNSYSKVSNMKSRSHSPLEKRSQKTDSRISKYSKYTAQHSQKQNIKRQQLTKKNSQFPSYQSKKILQQLHKSGVNYVPIHQRAEYLLKQKQAKLAQLQKEKALSQMMEQKECTFRPNIIKNYKKPNHTEKQDRPQRITEAEMNQFDQFFIDQEFLCPPTQPFLRQGSINSQQQILKRKSTQISQHEETKVVRKKYKNQKFNSLLDLIH